LAQAGHTEGGAVGCSLLCPAFVPTGIADAERARPGPGRKKLSYLEAREYETIEQRVADAEHVLQNMRLQLEDPGIVSDSQRLLAAQAQMDEAQEQVDTLYARWAELEKKKT
jgi:ATP-binding cassette subfamily F protein uup